MPQELTDFDLPQELAEAVDDSGEVLIHRTEAQHVAEWGTLLSEESDPPMVYRTRMRPGWQFHLPRFSLTCVETVLSESLFSCTPAASRP